MLRPTHLLALGGLVLVGILYWKPLHTYLHTQAELHRREGQVVQLEKQKRQLTQQIATVGSSSTLVLEARKLGLVKPGEQLYIVQGISAWRHHH